MQKMKRLGSVLAALVMMLALIPAVTPNAAAATAVINLAGLQAALDSGGEVALGASISSSTTLWVNADSTIDLNGYYLQIKTTTTSNGSGIVVGLGKTLTIKDSKFTGDAFDSGKLDIFSWYAGIRTNSATLIIDSGFVVISGGNYSSYTGTWGGAGIGGDAQSSHVDGGRVIINGGDVSVSALNGAGIGSGKTNYNTAGRGGNVKITGGTVRVTAKNGYDIGSYYIGGEGGTLEVTGGSLELGNHGTNVIAPVFKNCIIKGAGAEGFAALYGNTGSAVTVTFNKNASNASGNMAKMTLTGDAQNLPANTLTRKGYIFSGWATSKSGKVAYKNKASAAKIASGKKSITLYAVWTKVAAPAKAVTSLKLTSPKTKQLKVTYKKVSDAAGYRIEYSASKSFTKATTKTVHTTKLTYTLKSLSAKKTYYVRVTAYKTDSTKAKIYSKKTAAKNLKTK